MILVYTKLYIRNKVIAEVKVTQIKILEIFHFFLEIERSRLVGELILGLSLKSTVFLLFYWVSIIELFTFAEFKYFLSLFLRAINSFTKALLLYIILVIFSICLFFTSSLNTFLFSQSSNLITFLFGVVMLNFFVGEPCKDPAILTTLWFFCYYFLGVSIFDFSF